jgi:hypothetical protein
MSTVINGTNRINVKELTDLSRNLYENIFNVQLVDNDNKSFYTYNLLNKVIFPDSLNTAVVEEVTVMGDKPWTTLSFELYGTIELWWTIVLLNKPEEIFMAKAGTAYKYIKPGVMANVLKQLTVNE